MTYRRTGEKPAATCQSYASVPLERVLDGTSRELRAELASWAAPEVLLRDKEKSRVVIVVLSR